MRREFPDFRIVCKTESAMHRGIHVALMAITLGGMRQYLTSYHTTLGQAVYVTPGWDDSCFDQRYVTMCHERVHMRQFRRFGGLGMALLYGLLPLPLGLSYFRARFEKAAYAESIRATAELFGKKPGPEPRLPGQHHLPIHRAGLWVDVAISQPPRALVRFGNRDSATWPNKVTQSLVSI